MNVSNLITKNYEILDTWSTGKNEPKRTQNEPNFKKAKMNVTSYITKEYENISNWVICENEPNSNPNKLADAPVAGQFLSAISVADQSQCMLHLTINGRGLLWISEFATMTAISKSKDEERILVDCRCGMADN